MTDGPTNWPTDKAGYRVACTRLKSIRVTDSFSFISRLPSLNRIRPVGINLVASCQRVSPFCQHQDHHSSNGQRIPSSVKICRWCQLVKNSKLIIDHVLFTKSLPFLDPAKSCGSYLSIAATLKKHPKTRILFNARACFTSKLPQLHYYNTI